MRKLLSILLAALLLCSCTPEKSVVNNQGLTVITTLFPTYDFARSIAGGKADISLLITPGKESHSFEPSTGDVIRISESDIFIYTGENMEPWAQKVLSGLDRLPAVVDASSGLMLDEAEEDEHDHSDHDHVLEPHIWTSPRLCLAIVDNILAAFVELDPENAAFYRGNANALKAELSQLDDELMAITTAAPVKKIYHGGRFSMYYFARDYGLSYEAAYDSCSSDTEPSVRKICSMIDEMRKENTNVVFYEELSNNSVARLIADETGALPLLLHSCHNITKAELESGITYIDLMRQNAENLKEALK